jgi:hypothetical protein
LPTCLRLTPSGRQSSIVFLACFSKDVKGFIATVEAIILPVRHYSACIAQACARTKNIGCSQFESEPSHFESLTPTRVSAKVSSSISPSAFHSGSKDISCGDQRCHTEAFSNHLWS